LWFGLCQCKSGDVINNTSDEQAADSDVDDDDDDITEGRVVASGSGSVRDDEEAKLQGEDSSGQDLLSRQLAHRHDQADRDAEQQQGCDMTVARRRKRPAADHVTSSPSVDDDEEDYGDFGLPRSPPLRHQDDPASSPPQPGPASLEQTEIKIQRPLGLLAQHGITTKTPGAAMQVRSVAHSGSSMYKMDRPGDLDPTAMKADGRQQLSMGQHHHPPLAGLDFSNTPLSLMDRRFMPSPPAPSTPLSCLDPGKSTTSSPGAHHWTFEEQFKQVSIIL